MPFQLDLSQELKSLFDIGDYLFSDVPDTSSKRLSEADLKKQRIQRIHKKTGQNNQFAVNVWLAWAHNRNKSAGALLERYRTVPLNFVAVTKDELDFWLCRFINEAPRQDGRYIPLFLSNIWQFCNAAALTYERERERERYYYNKLLNK